MCSLAETGKKAKKGETVLCNTFADTIDEITSIYDYRYDDDPVHEQDSLRDRTLQAYSKVVSYTGGCYCHAIRYKITIKSEDEARTSLCHCKNCKRFTGGPFGVTIKIPVSGWIIEKGAPRVHISDNGSIKLVREFCGDCGSPILEYGEATAKDWRYVFHGTLDDTNSLPPKIEFFCKYRCQWMPEIEGVFHKDELKD